jgi:hypothetical protein
MGTFYYKKFQVPDKEFFVNVGHCTQDSSRHFYASTFKGISENIILFYLVSPNEFTTQNEIGWRNINAFATKARLDGILFQSLKSL